VTSLAFLASRPHESDHDIRDSHHPAVCDVGQAVTPFNDDKLSIMELYGSIYTEGALG
jgi:hypothetical protein